MTISRNLAIFTSGLNTTCIELLEACADGRLANVVPKLILSEATEETRHKIVPRLSGFPQESTLVVLSPERSADPSKARQSAELFSSRLSDLLRQYEIDLIILCGYMSKVPPLVVAEYHGMMFGLHPGPLNGTNPGFGGKGMHGLRVHQAVLNFARSIDRPFCTYATIYMVENEFGQGPVVEVMPVKVHPGDTPESLAARVQPAAHRLVVQTIFKLVQDDNCCYSGEGLILPNLVLPEELGLLRRAKLDALSVNFSMREAKALQTQYYDRSIVEGNVQQSESEPMYYGKITPDHLLDQDDPARRTIRIVGYLEDNNTSAICESIALVVANDPSRNIHLLINTPGGDEKCIYKLVRTLRECPAPLVGTVIKTAHCGGFNLLQFCGLRRALESATFVVQSPIDRGTGGFIFDDRLHNEVVQILVSRGKRSEAEIRAVERARVVVDADTALRYGYIDEIIPKLDYPP